MLSFIVYRGFFKFIVGEVVLFWNFGKEGKWVRGVVIEVFGFCYYIVKVVGNLWKWYID